MPILIDSPTLYAPSQGTADVRLVSKGQGTAEVRMESQGQPEVEALRAMLDEDPQRADQVGQSERNDAVVQWMRSTAPVFWTDRGYRIPNNAQQRQFHRLAKLWKSAHFLTSNPTEIAQHPAYLQMMSLGGAAVPLILSELKKSPDHWFVALHKLTGADPVPIASRGRLREMAKAWVMWGRNRGVPIP